jgi:GTPase SAR1 family protein
VPGKTPLKIFIASSGELEKERDQAILVLTRLNNAYKDLHLEPVRWEYAMVRGSFPEHENISAAIIPKLQESELAVFIFYSKLGVYTLEEFECAKNEKKKTLIFFKTGFSPNNAAEEEAFNKLKDFKSSLTDTVLMIDFDTPAAFAHELYANIHLCLSEKNIAAWHCTELNNIPNIKLAEFVGRTNELKELHHKIIQGNRVLVMNGIGGVGKTTLAKKYLQEHKQEYNHAAFVEVKLPDDNVDAAKIIPACHDAFANDNTLAVNLELQFDATTSNEVKFNRIINKLRNLPGKGLLVLDNMPLLPASSDLMDILPAPPDWTVLLTSRNVISGLERYDLDTLAPVEAATLFKKFYTGNCTAEQINDLLEEIGYHTLTTELLAKTLQNTDGLMHITTLTEKIKSKKLDDALLQEKITTGHHNKGETTVYLHLSQALSMAHLSDEEKWIIKNFAFLMPANYSTATLLEWLQVEEDKDKQNQFRENLRSLLQKGWLQQKEANSYTMHRMLQQLVQYHLAPVYNNIEKLVDTLQDKLNSDITTDYRVLFAAMPYAEYFLQSLSSDIYEHTQTQLCY